MSFALVISIVVKIWGEEVVRPSRGQARLQRVPGLAVLHGVRLRCLREPVEEHQSSRLGQLEGEGADDLDFHQIDLVHQDLAYLDEAATTSIFKADVNMKRVGWS